MTFTKVENGIYKSENGYIIKKKEAINMFTGRPMNSRETRWHIFNSNNEEVDWTFTLKEAKAMVENL